MVGRRVVDGRRAVIAPTGGTTKRVLSNDVVDARIAGVYIVANPAKLQALVRVLGLSPTVA